MFYIASATIFFFILSTSIDKQVTHIIPTYLFQEKSLKTSVTVSDFIIY